MPQDLAGLTNRQSPNAFGDDCGESSPSTGLHAVRARARLRCMQGARKGAPDHKLM
jgi:hypothetical protein